MTYGEAVVIEIPFCDCAQSAKEDAKEDSGSFRNFMTTFGAVPVGGRNFFKLLQNKEAVLLFPGGVREVRYIYALTLCPRMPPYWSMPPPNHYKSWLRCRDDGRHFYSQACSGDTYEANTVWKLARPTVHAGGLDVFWSERLPYCAKSQSPCDVH